MTEADYDSDLVLDVSGGRSPEAVLAFLEAQEAEQLAKSPEGRIIALLERIVAILESRPAA